MNFPPLTLYTWTKVCVAQQDAADRRGQNEIVHDHVHKSQRVAEVQELSHPRSEPSQLARQQVSTFTRLNCRSDNGCWC